MARMGLQFGVQFYAFNKIQFRMYLKLLLFYANYIFKYKVNEVLSANPSARSSFTSYTAAWEEFVDTQ